MRTIVMTVGVPASGKTTWAKEQLRKEPGRWKRVNRDDLRLMHDGRPYEPGTHDREKFITKASNALIREALKGKYDVLVDNTNLDGRARKEIHKIAEGWGDVTVIEKVFPVPLKELLRRDAGRAASVGSDVILNFAKRYHMDVTTGEFKSMKDNTVYHPPVQPNEVTLVEQDVSLPKAIVCDLDGTLALMNGRNPYDASTCDEDLPNWPVIECVKSMYRQRRKIVFVSGRQDKFKPQTIKFIEKWCRIPAEWLWPKENDDRPETIPIKYELHMRKSGDMRKDSLIKREIYDEHIKDRFYVEFVIDDRPQVVRMWRYDLGFTVFQLADKEF